MNKNNVAESILKIIELDLHATNIEDNEKDIITIPLTSNGIIKNIQKNYQAKANHGTQPHSVNLEK